MSTKNIFYIIIFSWFCSLAYGQSEQFILKGVILDKEDKKPVAYASIYILNNTQGAICDENGCFSISLNKNQTNRLILSSIGYYNDTITISTQKKELRVLLQSKSKMLEDFVVNPKRYRNKDNPAVELIRNVIDNKKNNKQESLDYYQNEKYEKVQFALNDITEEYKQKKMFKKFQFIFENTDTTSVKGKEMLPVYLKETLSDCYYQKSPEKTSEIIKATKQVSFEGIDNQGVGEYLKYMYQDIDIYENSVPLLTNQFLSPIAPSAPTFYRYYIMDTVLIDTIKCAKLFFAARNKSDMLFEGNLYVTLDGAYAISRVELGVNDNINMNWVKDIKIKQYYKNIPNYGWVISKDETFIDFGLAKNSRGFYGQRSVSYQNYQLQKALDNKSTISNTNTTLDSASFRSDTFWEEHRHEELSKTEKATYLVIDSVQKVPVFKRTMDIATLILFGYRDLGYFEVGPVNTFYSYNPIEGPRARFGGRTTPKFSKKLNLETYLAYGFDDDKFKYYLGSTWSLTPKTIFEFPVKSLKLSYQDDTKIPGQNLQFVQENNVLLSIKRGVNDKLFYNKTFKAEHLNEFNNHFSYTIGYQHTEQATGGNLYFNYTDYSLARNDVNNLNISEFYLNLRYAPHEQFYQGKSYRIPVLNDYPIFDLLYNSGRKEWGSDYNYQNLRLRVSKRFFFSVLGYTDVNWEAGKIFGEVPYPLLTIHTANQTYSYQLENYNLMNFLEFASDQYTSVMIDHCFNGFFLNKVPLVKRMKLREMLSCKILYGDISSNNNPNNNSSLYKLPKEMDGTPITYTLGSKPYIEGSVGISNLFKFFRVDLVKRFTYLDNPHVTPLGVRVRFKIDF